MSNPSATDKRRQRAHYLSQTAFAERLDISRVTVWRWVRDGRVRTIKLSPFITRIPVTEIDRLDQQEREQPSPRKRRKRLGAAQWDDEDDPPETD